MGSTGESVYVHGTHGAEQSRLAALNDILNFRTVQELRLGSEKAVLDVGCGLGQLAIAIAGQIGPGGHVLGIERSVEQLNQAKSNVVRAGLNSGQVEFRAGDALRLPLSGSETGSFDLAVTRFLLEHVPDPLAVVKQMVGAVRPGGRIALADDDHDVLRLHPEPPGVSKVWRAYIRLYDRNGNDPFVGRRLVQLLHQAGAVPKRNAWVWFGACSGDPSFVPLVLNMIGILEGAKRGMLQHALIEEFEFNEAIRSLQAFSVRPDAAMWFAMSYAEGVKPG